MTDALGPLVDAIATAVVARLEARQPPEPKPAPKPEPLMSRGEAAEHFGVSLATLDRWVRKGAPFLRVGCVKRFDRAELQAWLRGGGRRLRVVK